jgi:hypothetical protein
MRLNIAKRCHPNLSPGGAGSDAVVELAGTGLEWTLQLWWAADVARKNAIIGMGGGTAKNSCTLDIWMW